MADRDVNGFVHGVSGEQCICPGEAAFTDNVNAFGVRGMQGCADVVLAEAVDAEQVLRDADRWDTGLRADVTRKACACGM